MSLNTGGFAAPKMRINGARFFKSIVTFSAAWRSERKINVMFYR